MRLLVLYASDLAPRSLIAPGGINGNIRAYLGQLPDDWDIEVWGATADAADTKRNGQIQIGRQTIRLVPLLQTEPVDRRRIPLAPRYSLALTRAVWPFGRRLQSRDVIIAHRVEYLAALRLAVPRRRLPPAVLMIHGSSAASQAAFGRLWGGMHRGVERLAISSADAVALVSRVSIPYYRKRYPDLAERFVWIPNGVDLNRFRNCGGEEWRRRNGFDEQDRLLMYHGRYGSEKGIRRMLAVFRLLITQDPQPWHLVCAGSGPEGSAIREAQATWGEGRIRDLGYLNPEAIPEMLCAGDVGLLFSDFEGMSNGLLEALAAGLPVVATNVGDNGVVLSHVSNDLVGPAEPSVLAEKVRWAWTHRRQLSTKALRAAETFSLDKRVERLVSLFRTIASQRA